MGGEERVPEEREKSLFLLQVTNTPSDFQHHLLSWHLVSRGFATPHFVYLVMYLITTII